MKCCKNIWFIKLHKPLLCTIGTQYIMLVMSYPLVMGATAHLYLPVYDTIQITTSYEYLEIRQPVNVSAFF